MPYAETQATGFLMRIMREHGPLRNEAAALSALADAALACEPMDEVARERVAAEQGW